MRSDRYLRYPLYFELDAQFFISIAVLVSGAYALKAWRQILLSVSWFYWL
jgi:hypothetical protein